MNRDKVVGLIGISIEVWKYVENNFLIDIITIFLLVSIKIHFIHYL